MDIPLDPDNPHFAKLMSVQQSIISSILTTTARVNEAQLRKQQDDRLKALLTELEAERRHMRGRGEN